MTVPNLFKNPAVLYLEYLKTAAFPAARRDALSGAMRRSASSWSRNARSRRRLEGWTPAAGPSHPADHLMEEELALLDQELAAIKK